MFTLFLLSLAVQPGPPMPPPAATIRPGEAPEGTSPVPISEVAEPIGLAIAGFDADHDGRTSQAEYEEALVRTFAGADRDGNSALGYIEYSGWAETWLGSQTALPGPFAIDADGDNSLSRGEFMAEFARQFTRLDKSADGAVSRAELLTLRNPRMAPVLDRDGRFIRQRQRREER
jgi:hypothetical protein